MNEKYPSRLLQIAPGQGVLRPSHQLRQIRDERGALALDRARVRQDDHARALEAEQGLGDLKVRAAQLGRDSAHVARPVDHGQHFPLGREEIESTAAALLRGRERGHDAEVRDAPFDAGPLVDAARAFHQ